MNGQMQGANRTHSDSRVSSQYPQYPQYPQNLQYQGQSQTGYQTGHQPGYQGLQQYPNQLQQQYYGQYQYQNGYQDGSQNRYQYGYQGGYQNGYQPYSYQNQHGQYTPRYGNQGLENQGYAAYTGYDQKHYTQLHSSQSHYLSHSVPPQSRNMSPINATHSRQELYEHHNNTVSNFVPPRSTLSSQSGVHASQSSNSIALVTEAHHHRNSSTSTNSAVSATSNASRTSSAASSAAIERSTRVERIYGSTRASNSMTSLSSEPPRLKDNGPSRANMSLTTSMSALNLDRMRSRNAPPPPIKLESLTQAYDLDTPPLPGSEPVSPLTPPASFDSLTAPSRKGTPTRLAKMFGLRGADSNSSAPGSATSSRHSSTSPRKSTRSTTNSPSFASRLSSRINSGLSGLTSRSDSRRTDKRSNSTISDTGSPVTSSVELPKELSNNWARFEPRRAAGTLVVSEFARLAEPRVPLIDIDHSEVRQALPMNSILKPEMRPFAARGIYFTGTPQSEPGKTDDEGNYLHQRGEHIGFRYQVVDELGKGSFGTVLRCRDHRTGRMVALKVTANRAELQGQARIEAKMLRSLIIEHQGDAGKHHFLRYVEHFSYNGHLCIATELLGPNLYEVSKRNAFRGLSEPTVQYISRQLLEGLEFLASQGIIHCDMKPENVLVSDVEHCQVKIVDFGSGCYERQRMFTYIQSRFYRAPEILLGIPYGPAIDMWSLGTIVPELLLGEPLFPSVDEPDLVLLISEVLGCPAPQVLWKSRRAGVFFDVSGMPLDLRNSKGELRRRPGSTPLSKLLERCSPDAIDFCRQILQWLPEDRLTAEKAIYHPFVVSQ